MIVQPGLSIVGAIPIRAAVLQHRFALEGLAAIAVASEEEDPRKRVIGTSNQPDEVELYGWAQDITRHRDNSGWIYGVCLNPGRTRLFATDERTPTPGETIEVELSAGTVFRLDDYFTHWTQDSGPRLAAFIGPFAQPCDDLALAKLREAIEQLAKGVYSLAPRVSGGFRVLLADECWATHDYESRSLMLLADAKASNADVLCCAECDKPAAIIDHYWPYEQSANRCYDCK
ncbi:hypothetical protein KZ843_09420 [Pseudomonas aeruginosa]|nr:hypothetical protein [Pseudomonas aeruginosa]MBW6123103.1 hypothetical protein [Pseudomonas aeruginosa]